MSLPSVPTPISDPCSEGPGEKRLWTGAASPSHHAAVRMQQRAVDESAVDAALRWGCPVRQRGGRTAWFLGRRHCLAAERAGESIARYAGTIVVEAADGTIITVVRSFNTRKLRRRAR